MREYLRNTDALIDSQHGWEQMQLLLDENLPVINKYPKSGFFLKTLPSAFLVILFLMSGLLLNDQENFKSYNILLADNKGLSDRTDYSSISFVDKDIKFRSEDNRYAPVKTNSSAAEFKVMHAQLERQYKETERFDISTLVDSPQTHKIENISLSSQQNELVKNPSNISKPVRSWHLYAGLAINATNTKEQIFRPYPLAVLRYDLSKKFFLSSSLSVGSSITSQSQGLDKKIYLNDTVNNILYYDKVNHYHKIVYTDLSVNAGIDIGKNISLEAGIQASVLIKSKSKSIIEPYDFQMRMTGSATDNILPVVTAMPVSTTDYKVGIRNFDYRFTTGINYSKNKFRFGLTYQHSFTPMIKGDITSGSKNQLVSFNVLYKIK